MASSIIFTGGPIAALGAIVGGSGYMNGTYTNVPLTGGAGAGALATVTIAGGTVTAVGVTNPGAPVGQFGATGFQVGDVLSAAASSIGGTGSGFSVPVASIGPYQWSPPFGESLFEGELCSPGAGGGGGAASGSNAGGGGGGGASLVNVKITVLPEQVLTIYTPSGAPGGAVGQAGAQADSAYIRGGFPDFWPDTVPISGYPGQPGTTTAPGYGGYGGAPSTGGGPGGAPGQTGSQPQFFSPGYCPGTGGGGGGDSSENPGNGGSGYPFAGGAAAPGPNGGAGGSSAYGRGAPSVNGAAGVAATEGWGGGGSGGAPGQPGGQGGMAGCRLSF